MPGNPQFMPTIPFLDFECDDFPPIEMALDEPNGLLAAGGDLSSERLIRAYRMGIFPWYEEGQPILWWSPAPRAVVMTRQYTIPRTLRKLLRKKNFEVTMDTAFEEVIEGCAAPRPDSEGTWITEDMITAYIRLHYQGYAHSVECWQDGELVGGLYGVSLGKLFFGESMFSRVSNASKVAYMHLIKHCETWSFPIIDCQIDNPHLSQLGTVEISRDLFKDYLMTQITDANLDTHKGKWSLTWSVDDM